MRVAFFGTKNYDRDFFDRFNTDHGHDITYFEARLNHQTVNLVDGHQAVCAFVNDQIDEPAIRELHAKGVKLIAMRCAGYNNVDLHKAAECGIRVARVPAYSPEGVAEFAVALILTLNRKTHKAYNRVREHNFSLERLMGFDLHGKAVGVIGTGKIGQAFCRVMQGFGNRIVAHDPYPNEVLRDNGVVYTSLDNLFAQSDIISLHCPLIPETHYLIDQQAIRAMKPGVMLINTSRGKLLDTSAVIEGLRNRKIGYLGIDVYENEESIFYEDLSENILADEEITTLMTFPNVLITSHQSFFTREAVAEITQTTLQNITDFETGKPLVNEIRYEAAH